MKKWRGVLSVLIAVLIIVPFTFVNAEDATYSYEFVDSLDIAYIVPDGATENVTESKKPSVLNYSPKYIFDGYYADADYTKEYTFGALTENTKIYLKFTASGIEEKIKKALDEANLKVTSTLTEKEGAEAFTNNSMDFITSLTQIDEADLPTITLDGYTVTVFSKSIDDSYRYRISYKYTNTKITSEYSNYDVYDYYIPITYSNSENHDSELQQIADPYESAGYREIPGLIDYTNIPDKEDFDNAQNVILTEEQVTNVYKETIGRLKGMDNFELVESDFSGPYTGQYEAGYFAFNYLLNGENVYGYLILDNYAQFTITVDSSVENSQDAYFDSVKDQIKAFFESKGYKNVEVEKGFNSYQLIVSFDEDDVHHYNGESYYYEEHYYADNGRGYITINMMKDYNTFLLAKNLTTNYTDQSLYHFYALSYNEYNEFTKKQLEDEELTEDQKKGIEEDLARFNSKIDELKTLIDNDGYDFFDGYNIGSYYDIPEGSTAKLTFTVGTENNNRRIRVYHKKQDGSIEKFEGIVKDGEFTIEATELSPFAVGLGEVVKALKNNPQTFDPIVLTIILLVVSSIGACVSMKLLKD